DRNRSHWSTSKTPSYTKSVSWQHHLDDDDINAFHELNNLGVILDLRVVASDPSINIIDKINEQLIAN
ncbi:hypothetical protein SNB02_21825, partial [Escherichia coli]|nr:hypothetical protein [Escherichia coli]